jgi:hypothetical protein
LTGQGRFIRKKGKWVMALRRCLALLTHFFFWQAPFPSLWYMPGKMRTIRLLEKFRNKDEHS